MQGVQVLLIILAVLIFGGMIMLIMRRSKRKDDVMREPMLQLVRKNFGNIKPDYATIPLSEGGSSYTEDKNAIVLCLKDPHTGSTYDANTVMYVALHELAHVISKSYSVEEHNDEFKKNFAKLLSIAESKGFYDPSRPIPPNYCGTGGH